MPYVYKDAYVLKNDITATWERRYVNRMPLGYLHRTFRGAYLKLTHTATEKQEYWINLIELMEDVDYSDYNPSMTVADWLEAMGNRTLPTSDHAPRFNPRYIRYIDAWDLNFHIRPGRIGYPQGDVVNPSDPDLILTGKDFDHPKYSQMLLGVVNGYLHRVSGSAKTLGIREGNTTGRVSQDNQVGLLDFSPIGRIRTYPITPDMIKRVHPEQSLYTGLILKLPEPVSGRTVIPVIGGIPQFPDASYHAINDHLLYCYPNRMGLMSRLMEAAHHLDLSTLQIHKTRGLPDILERSQFTQDETVQAYFHLPQSFLVYIEARDVYMRKVQLEVYPFPGRYASEAPNRFLPMIGPNGRVLNYRTNEVSGVLEHHTPPVWQSFMVANTRPWEEDLSIDDRTTSYEQRIYATPHLLEFGTFK